MRGLSTSTALRALRSANRVVFPPRTAILSRTIPVRPLCAASTPPAIAPNNTTNGESTTATEASIVAESVDAAAFDTVSAVPETKVEAPAAIDAEKAISENTHIAPDAGLEPNVVGESAPPTRTTEAEMGERYDVSHFSSAEELTEKLQELVKQSSLKTMLLFREVLRQEGVPFLTAESIQIVLPVMARNGWFASVKETLHVAHDKDIVLSTVLYNCALFAMTRTGDLESMHGVLKRMNSGDPKYSRPNATSFNLLIAAHFYKGSVDEAFAVLEEMKGANVYPTIATYQTLVSGCLRRRDYTRAFQTLVAIEQQGMTVSAMTVAQVLHYAANEDNFDQVMHLLTKLEALMEVYGGDIDRISAKRSSYDHKPFRTTEYYRESVRGSPRLELATITAVFHCACRGGRPDIATMAWNMFVNSYPELQPTADHWYSLIGALANSGDFAAAFDGVGHMREAGFEPTAKDLNNMLVRPLSSDVEKIDDMYFHLVERLEGKDQSPVENEVPVVEEAAPQIEQEEPNVTASEILEEIEEVESLSQEDDKHVSLSEEIGIGNLEPAPEVNLPWSGKRRAEVGITELNCIIGACALVGDLDRAFQTYDEACGRLGFIRNADTLNALLECCVQTRHLRGGQRIVEEARTDGTLMNAETLHLTVRLHLRNLRVDDAFDLIREAASQNVEVYARTWQMVARHLSRTSNSDAVTQCLELAVQQGYRIEAIRPRMRMDRTNSNDESAAHMGFGNEGSANEVVQDKVEFPHGVDSEGVKFEGH